MKRPSFYDIYMRLAVLMSERSTCTRVGSTGELMKVGCAIVSTDFRRVHSVGYNGNASGLPNQCDSHEPGKCGCIHAEANAVVNCSVGREEPKIVFCTHLPCTNCAKLLIQLGGVEAVYYRQDYRLKDSLLLFSHPQVDIAVGHFREGDTKDEAQVRAAEARTAWVLSQAAPSKVCDTPSEHGYACHCADQ